MNLNILYIAENEHIQMQVWIFLLKKTAEICSLYFKEESEQIFEGD